MKVNIFKKINKSLGKKSIIIITVLVFFGLSLAAPAFAANDWAIKVVGGILGVIVSAVGLILVLAINSLVLVAQYSTFLDSGAVVFGWIIVRDLCNMFFVVVLLIIAFGTILNIEKYNYKKWLPKLILMAILINFSKTICGILIDVAQVVMLTFVNSFSTIGAGTLVNVLGITDILQIAGDSKDIGFWTVIGAYLLGLAYVIIALIVVVTMIAMLAIRVVMIWIYVVLSPLAYLLSAFPGGQSYASKWWTDFTKNLIVGPVLAFFLWLSLAALSADEFKNASYDNLANEADATTKTEQQSITGAGPINDSVSAMGTKASSPGALIKFVIAIGMLVGGLKIAQEIGGAAGSMAGKGMAAVNKAGKIGLAGAAAITGVRAVQGIAKSYQANRKTNRERRYRNVANSMTNATENISKNIKDKVTKVKDGIKETTYKTFGVSTKGQEQDLEKKRVDLEDLEQNSDTKRKNAESKEAEYENMKNQIPKKGEFSADGTTYSHNGRDWVDQNTGKAVSGAVLSDMLIDKKAESEQARKDYNSHEGNKDTLEKDIATTEEDVTRKKERQKDLDNVLRTGAYVVAGGAAVLTGGVVGGAVVGASAAANKVVKKYGEEDVAVGSDYRLQGVKKAGEKLNDEDDKTIIAKMDDNTLSRFTRAAAALEAMRRGLISSDKAQKIRKRIGEEVGGYDEDNKKIKDKKLNSYFETVAAKSYPSATKDFENINSVDPDKAKEAKVNIIDKIDKGILRFDNMDKASLTQAMELMVSRLSSREIKSQYDSIKDPSRKKEVADALTGVANSSKAPEANKNKALESLKDTIGLEAASKKIEGTNSNIVMEKLLAKLSFTDLRDAFVNGTLSQQNAIINAIKSSSKVNKIDVLTRAKITLENGSPASKAMKKELGL